MTYTQTFYDVIRDGCRASAAVIVPLLIAAHHPKSVVDVGCGEGHFRDVFRNLGVEATGVDGPWVEGPDRTVELDQPLPDLGRFDVAVCLEVAEHLPPERAEGFVADLCRLAPVVAFSAAIPNQGGWGHVNEQWPAYWADLFASHGYRMDGSIRFDLWGNPAVEWWYQQNLMICSPTANDNPLPLVHPTLYESKR